MVHTSIDQNASSERQEIIDWLISHNYPALPVAPAQSARKYYKVAPGYPKQGVWSHCPLTADLQPIPLFIGKNPSYLDDTGKPHLINHRKYQRRLPNQQELEVWFTNPDNGVGTLGGWNNTVWLDFDVKQFPSQQECDAAVSKIIERPELSKTFIERSHSGGWRIGVRVKQKPNFTNFSVQNPNQSISTVGSHVGEALFEGRFTVLAPTIGPSGNLYQSIQRAIPVEVESLESIGIYSTKRKRGSGKKRETGGDSLVSSGNKQQAFPQSPTPGCIPLEFLGNDTSRDILQGNCPTGDRSEALTTATKEWYGWQNWAYNNSIPISGDATTLAHYAGTQLGLDSDRIDRILKTIDEPTSYQPAALYRGGEESCWKKIYRLDKTTFEAKCPTHIKAALTKTFAAIAQNSTNHRDCSMEQNNGNSGGSGGGRRGGLASVPSGDDADGNNRSRASVVAQYKNERFDMAALRSQIKNILIQDLPPSELQTAKIRIRKNFPGVSEREISQLFETLEQELELSESRSERRCEVDNLLKLGDQSLNLNEFLPTDLAQPLTQLAHSLNIRPEVCLTTLLVASSSLHKTQTELVIHRGQGFSVPPTIFAGLVSESGQKKSPILKAVIKKPLSVLQREKREAYQRALAQYEKEIIVWDKCKSEERSSKYPEGKPKLPQQRLYYFTNATGEGLLYQFQAHPDKALLALVDELAGLFASQNKYTGGRGSDRQDILSAFDGTGATVLRAAGTKADLDGLLLSICGTIQPEILKRLMRDCSDPDGQWARFLFVNQPLAAATLADDNSSSVSLSELLLNYYRAIDQLPAREYRLSREAFKRYQPIYNQLERLRVSHPNPGMRAVYSKMEGYIGRIALNLHVLHELKSGKTLPTEEIPLSIMEMAIALAKFYIGQVKLIHANCAADLGDMAPHLVKIVELSKRMDATTGNSWIKAKVVQTGYDSRHRPRPDAVRSWFRELEALGIGSTRGAGIRLEYSWKLPDLPMDDSEPPPQEKEEKVDKSGEKWITSPPTETTKNQGFPQKEEKVDNPTPLKKEDNSTHMFDLIEPTTDCGVRDANKLGTEKESSQSLSESVAEFLSTQATPEKSTTQSSEGDEHFILQTKNSLETTDSAYPLSGCDDGIAPTEAVDTQSTFSPPVDTQSTLKNPVDTQSTLKNPVDTQSAFEDPVDSVSTVQTKMSSNEVGAGKEAGEFEEGREDVSTSPATPDVPTVSALLQQLKQITEQLTVVVLGIQIYCSSFVQESNNLPNPPEVVDSQATAVSPTSECDEKVNLVKLDDCPQAVRNKVQDTTFKESDRAKHTAFKAGDRAHWVNCPTSCEELSPFAIMWIEGEYAKLDLFPKLVPLKELLRPD